MMSSSGNAQDDTNIGVMQPCKSKTLSSNPEALWGSRVGCYNGDGWSRGLTYFSFWEGLLWPASALNCALFPESKGKPKTRQIERDSRKSKTGRDRATNKPKCAIFKAESVKVMKVFKECGILSIWIDGSAAGSHGKRLLNDFSNSKRSTWVKVKEIHGNPPYTPTS